mgnify:FL=1
MTQKERYDKICELVDITDEIRDKLRNIVYEPQEGDFKNHFDNLFKAEKVAIIGILNDASRLASSIASYQHWFEEK